MLENFLSISFPIDQTRIISSNAAHPLHIDLISTLANLRPILVQHIDETYLRGPSELTTRDSFRPSQSASVSKFEDSSVTSRKIAARIIFHRCQTFLTSNHRLGAWQEDWILHGYRSDCATSFRQSREKGGIDRPLPPRSYRWEKAPDLHWEERGGAEGGINPSLNDALSPPFIKRSFRRLQVAARRLMEFLGDGGGRSCE